MENSHDHSLGRYRTNTYHDGRDHNMVRRQGLESELQNVRMYRQRLVKALMELDDASRYELAQFHRDAGWEKLLTCALSNLIHLCLPQAENKESNVCQYARHQDTR